MAVPYEDTSFLVPSPSSLPVPDGVDADVWQQLTRELERQLISVRGASRVGDGLVLRNTSTPPMRPLSQAVLGSTSTHLVWGYYSNGDYDQNSEVNVADLTPIAKHFQETAVPFKFLPNSIQAVIDGDNNGEINLADVTPIAINFQNNVESYNVYRSTFSGDYPDAPDDGNGGAELFASVLLDAATGNPNETRLQLTNPFPEAYDNDYFWVRPEDNEATEGIASNRLGPLTNTYSLNGHIYLAGGGTDPLQGVPVGLTGDATASTLTNEFGHYSFEVQNGNYTITPTGDPYGYTPVNVDATIAGGDKYISPIYPAPVNIVHRWALDGGITAGSGGENDLKIDAEGNIFVTDIVGYWDDNRFYLLKYDMFGELLWSQVYELPYFISTSKMFLLPSGEMYLSGQYTILEAFDPNDADLYVMKLDSSGNIIWDHGFNYPPIGLEDHWDTGVGGYLDALGNLHLHGYSSDQTPFVDENYTYLLTISPDGDLLEQTHLEPTFAGHDNVYLGGFVYDQQGGLIVGGSFNGDSSNQLLLMRITPTGEIDWINNWGDNQVGNKGLKIGDDGFIYQLFRGHPPGNTADRGWQISRFDSSGIRDWEIHCTIENVFYGSPKIVIGLKGKLWFTAHRDIPDTINFTVYPYIWSFEPEDGSLRFSQQWECDDFDIDHGGVARVSGLEVNQYGVAVLSGIATSSTGEWVDQTVTIQETNWEITHDNSLTFETDDPKADWRSLPVSQIPDVGMVDPPAGTSQKTFIMFYRP